MKFSRGVRSFFLCLFGLKRSPAIDAAGLKALADREPVLLLGMHGVDPRLPGKQVHATLGKLAEIVRDLPKGHAIVAHCG